jgi:hypothetical protein
LVDVAAAHHVLITRRPGSFGASSGVHGRLPNDLPQDPVIAITQPISRTVDVDIGDIAGLAQIRDDPLNPTIFHERWWLIAASDGKYEEISVSAGGRVVGRFPFVVDRVLPGFTLCGMPELSHFLGPAIDAGSGSAANRALRRDRILRDLLEKLPSTTGLYQKLHSGFSDTLVFQELGYRTMVQFTYEIAPAPLPAIWAGMRDKTRNAIRSAQGRYRIAETPDPTRFAALYGANLRDRGSTNHYRVIRQLCEAALWHDRGRIILAFSGDGRPAAGVFYVWDTRAAYYLLSTRNEHAGNAVSLLIWQVIQDCATQGLIFDFDGVATPGSRVFYTGFGGQVKPRYIVSRYSLGHRIAGRLSNPFRLPTKHSYQW